MRCLLYSPDSYGLGHINRSLAIASHLLSRFPDSRIRLLTGAPRAHFFDYPDRCDYVVLPGVTKDGQGRYVSSDPGRSLAETVATRARLVEHEVLHFRPDVLLVDHAPEGLCGDLRDLLPKLARDETPSIVLGMRDVVDDPARVRRDWTEKRVFDLMERCYDAILVYGDREIFDPVEEYGFPAAVASKTRHVGYIRARTDAVRSGLVRSLFAPRTDRMVLITLGGGGDGNVLLDAAYRALASLGPLPPFETLSVTGPLMSPGKRARFRRKAGSIARLTQLDFTPAMSDLIRSADLVLSMGGYNTVCELAAANANAIIVPRDTPRREQLVRARRLAARGVVEVVEPAAATPSRLASSLEEGLRRPTPAGGWGLSADGLERVADAIGALVAARPGAGGRR